MTVEEYKKLLTELDWEYDDKIKKIYTDFAISNNPYKEGDIITDHYHTIRITRISMVFNNAKGMPECIYFGIVLKKDLSPKKDQSANRIWQSNIIDNKK